MPNQRIEIYISHDGLHLKNIYHEGELDELATTEEFSVVRTEGKRSVRRRIKHYNLDAIISVGYRVSPQQALGEIDLSQSGMHALGLDEALETIAELKQVLIAKGAGYWLRRPTSLCDRLC